MKTSILRGHCLFKRQTIASFCLLCLLGAVPLAHGQAVGTERTIGQTASQVQILTGNVTHRTGRAEKEDVFSVTGVSDLKVSKTRVSMEEDGRAYAAYLTVSRTFGDAEMSHLLIRVGSKIFVAKEFGGNAAGVYNTIDLRLVDADSAMLLNGGALPMAPKALLKIDYTPDTLGLAKQGSHYVSIVITNVSSKPVTFFWGTTGGQNYPCRDTRLSFTATHDGTPVRPNPKPLPPGFISSPITLQPGSFLRRHENLNDWLEIADPGRYLVSASYLLNIQNSKPDAGPSQWWVAYQNQLAVQVARATGK